MPHENAERKQPETYAPQSIATVESRWPVPHPIPYQGSKRCLAPTILDYFPRQFDTLVEPFAGSAAISLAVAYKGMAKRFVINDAHEPLAALWKEIVERPAELADEYRDLWNDQRGRERAYFDEVRARFNTSHRPSTFLYLLARCVKAAIRYNADGEFNNSPDNRRKGATPEAMGERISGASALLRNRVVISSRDYLEVVAECSESCLIYMDPPYQGVSGKRDSRYAPKVDHDEFCTTLGKLNEKGLMYVVSYDGRMGGKVYGEALPKYLGLLHLEVKAGRSSQATLLGRDSQTYESLYISPSLAAKLANRSATWRGSQPSLFD